jgi:hypothetical protein
MMPRSTGNSEAPEVAALGASEPIEPIEQMNARGTPIMSQNPHDNAYPVVGAGIELAQVELDWAPVFDADLAGDQAEDGSRA